MKLFKTVKIIKSKTGELHFERFALIETELFAVYIHRIHKADKDAYCHSHPWNFWSIILKGGYVEKFHGFHDRLTFRLKSPGSVSHANRDYFHKIETIIIGPVYSLFITWGKHKPRFYKTENGTVESTVYRELKK